MDSSAHWNGELCWKNCRELNNTIARATRVGVINVCSKNDLYHDLRDVIIKLRYMLPFPALIRCNVTSNTTKQHSLYRPATARVKMNTYTPKMMEKGFFVIFSSFISPYPSKIMENHEKITEK